MRYIKDIFFELWTFVIYIYTIALRLFTPKTTRAPFGPIHGDFAYFFSFFVFLCSRARLLFTALSEDAKTVILCKKRWVYVFSLKGLKKRDFVTFRVL